MTQAAFQALLDNCNAAFRDYVTASTKTHRLLAELTMPPNFQRRREVVNQRIAQSEAHTAYSDAREALFGALRAEAPKTVNGHGNGNGYANGNVHGNGQVAVFVKDFQTNPPDR